MRALLLTTGLALSAVPAAAQLVPSGPVGSLDSLMSFADQAPRAPLAWGLAWDPVADPERRLASHYLVAADSTVWIESPSGQTVTVDPYSLSAIAEAADEQTGATEALWRRDGVGYGYQDGRVYLEARQGAPVAFATALALGLLVAVPGLAVWLATRLRRERRQRALLNQAYRRHLEVREDERLRVAQDVHDGPVQDLNLVNLRLAVLAPGDGQTGQPAEVAALRTEVVGVIRELRGISEALRPPALGPFGLAAALRVHAERFETLHPDVDVALDLDDDGQSVPEGVRLALFRVAQEALTNAAKHAQPSTVAVTLRLDKTTLSLAVSDDGLGYTVPRDLSAFAATGHYGLAGMAERAAAIGARLQVESAPETGTTVTMRVRRDAPEWASPAMQHRV